MIFGTWNLEKIWHEITDFSTSPPLYLGKSKKSHFQQYYSYILLIIYIISQENTPPENVTTLTYKLQNFFHLTEGLLCFFKRWRLWKEPVTGCRRWLWKETVVMSGNWNVRQAVSQQVFRVTIFCISTCFQSFFDTDQSHSAPRCAEIQPMSQQAAASSRNMSISIHALLL